MSGRRFRNLTGCFLVLAVVAFTLFGNRSKLIIEKHQGADDEQMTVAHLVLHGDSQHEDEHHKDQHDGQQQDCSEDPIHHHHVEVSPVLVIAVVTPGDLSLFQPIVSLPRQFADEICPPSPSSEIVKPPQMV